MNINSWNAPISCLINNVFDSRFHLLINFAKKFIRIWDLVPLLIEKLAQLISFASIWIWLYKFAHECLLFFDLCQFSLSHVLLWHFRCVYSLIRAVFLKCFLHFREYIWQFFIKFWELANFLNCFFDTLVQTKFIKLILHHYFPMGF